MRPDLLRWQWDGYPQFHARPLNLLIHLVAVPSFGLSLLALLWGVATLQWLHAGASFGGMALAFLAQAIGHGREKTPAIPFTGPVDAVSRVFAEQLVSFPRFVLSGAWWRALRAEQRG